MGGKEDWLAAGLPVQGEQEGVPPLVRLARTDVAVCRLDSTVNKVAAQLEDSDLGFALVLNDAAVVLGKVRRRDVRQADGQATAADLLVEGPTTVRAHEDVVDLTERMGRVGTGSVVVTTGQGQLLGVLVREDAEQVLEEAGIIGQE